MKSVSEYKNEIERIFQTGTLMGKNGTAEAEKVLSEAIQNHPEAKDELMQCFNMHKGFSDAFNPANFKF